MTTPATPGESAASPELGERSPFYLYPGKLFASREPHAVTTILGSCVAVCLWDRRSLAGGVNHFLFPSMAEEHPPSPRFGDVATKSLIGELLDLGSSQRDLEAKLFGGASVIGITSRQRGRLGADNVEAARQVLAAHAIPVVAEDVGGPKGRKLIFHTDAGMVWIRRL